MFFRLSQAIVLATGLIASLNAQQMDEYHVKAAFLYNFTKFVDWPGEAFRGPGDPFAICVVGEDPFGRALNDVVSGRAIAGRPLVVRHISDVRQDRGCQVLFVSSSASKHVLAVLAAAKQAGVLTVGETDNSTSGDVVINFILIGGKVRFEINMVAAEEQKLRLSSKLLSLATTVRK